VAYLTRFQWNSRYTDFGVVVLLYAFSIVYFLFDVANPIYQVENIQLQLRLLLGISLCTALIVLSLNNSAPLFIAAIIDTIFVILILILHRQGTALRFWVGAALLYRFSVRFRVIVSIPLSVVFFLAFLINDNRPVFGRMLGDSLSSDIWFLSFSYLVVIFCAR
jgi:hypothetical protein